jgi:hypothetical protein
LPFPNFDVVFMNSIVIHVVIKIEWMKQWYESVLLPYFSHSDTKRNIKALYEFSVCFPSSSRKISLYYHYVWQIFMGFFCECFTIRVYPNFVQFPTVICTNKTDVWVVTWKQH